LMLARAQGPAVREPVALDEVARTVVDDVNDAAKARRISIKPSLGSCIVAGDPVLLEHLVRNLLENAIRHNVDGGWVHVESGANGAARFSVSNSGVVIQHVSVVDLFAPLHRGDFDRVHTSGTGFGLGLAIVKAVAEGHHGRVTAEPLVDGGMMVEVTLPALEAVPRPRVSVGPRVALGS